MSVEARINQERVAPVLDGVLRACVKRGIQPSPLLGDAYLIGAAVMFEKELTRAAFLDRCAQAWDEMVGAGDPDEQSKRDFEAILQGRKI